MMMMKTITFWVLQMWLGISWTQGLLDNNNNINKMEWNPNNYSQEFANNTLMYAYGAYCSSSSLASWTCKWCKVVPRFQIAKVVDLDYLQAFTGFDPDYNQVIISFRGTANIEDWLDDFDAVVVEYPGVPGGLVHKGFYTAWEDLKPQIMASAQSLISAHPHSQIMVTGHSLGAALAQVSSLDIFSYASQVSSTGYRFVETFGSPRWCNDVMVNYFEGLADVHWRIVNIKDIVPTVPPEDRFYHHTPIMVWYTSDVPLAYKLCDQSGEDPSCEYIGYSIYDHLHYLNVYEDCT